VGGDGQLLQFSRQRVRCHSSTSTGCAVRASAGNPGHSRKHPTVDPALCQVPWGRESQSSLKSGQGCVSIQHTRACGCGPPDDSPGKRKAGRGILLCRTHIPGGQIPFRLSKKAADLLREHVAPLDHLRGVVLRSARETLEDRPGIGDNARIDSSFRPRSRPSRSTGRELATMPASIPQEGDRPCRR